VSKSSVFKLHTGHTVHVTDLVSHFETGHEPPPHLPEQKDGHRKSFFRTEIYPMTTFRVLLHLSQVPQIKTTGKSRHPNATSHT